MNAPLLRRSFYTAVLFTILCCWAGQSAVAHLAIVRQGPETGGGVQESGDWYGGALAVGDFNNDGFDDLVSGAPFDDIGNANTAGAITVNYGCPTGLTTVNARFISQLSLDFTSEENDWFGYSLAVGDFNNDNFDDLAVGAPGEDPLLNGPGNFMGNVTIIYGSASGLDEDSAIVVSQANATGNPEANDFFGFSLAAGDFNGDNFDDLAVGVRDESLEGTVTISNAGAIQIFSGSASGIDPAISFILTDDDTGGDAQPDARFGYALTSGDFDDDGFDDLAVGIPFKELTSLALNHGVVEVIYGTIGSLNVIGYQEFDVTDFGGTRETDARFGNSLATGQTNNDNYADLGIGAPYDGNGDVWIVPGSGPGLLQLDAYRVSVVTSSPNDELGFAFAFGDWNDNGYDDIAVGEPGDLSDRGQIRIYPARDDGTGITVFSTFSTVNNQEVLNEVSEVGDRLGAAVAAGAFAGGTRHAFAYGAPGEDYEPFPGSSGVGASNSGQVYIDMPWLQVQNMTCRGAILTNCTNDVVFSFKAFESHQLASTTKIMTLLIAAEATQPGCNPCANLTDVYTAPLAMCDSANVAGGMVGGSDADLCPGELIQFGDLLRGMMYPSGNDAAFSIADHLINPGSSCTDNTCQDIFDFATLMNQRAAQIGMPSASFENPSGAAHGNWPSDNVSSANDMARLAFTAMQNPLVAQIAGRTTTFPITRVNYICGSPNTTYCNNAAPVPGCTTPDFPNGSGIKGGSTPPAGLTFVGSVDHPDGRFFGVTLGHANNTARRNEFNNMLTLGANVFCVGPFVPQPPPPGTTLAAPDVPSQPGFGTKIGFNLDQDAVKPFNARVTLADGASSAFFQLKLTRDIQSRLDPGEMASQSIAPFDSHNGIMIENIGDDPIQLLVTFDQPSATFNQLIARGESIVIPPYTAPSVQAGANLTIINTSSLSTAFLNVSEMNYCFDRRIVDAGSFEVRMTQSHLNGEDQVKVEFIGQDNDPNAAVDLFLAQTFDNDPGCDGALTLDDIDPFVQAVLDPANYAALYPFCYIGSADRNNDGLINGRDVAGFVNDLLNP